MKTILYVIALSILFLLSCNKEESLPSCYDVALVHNGACTTDCPGFIGCDRQSYCNECEAARLGIGPQ